MGSQLAERVSEVPDMYEKSDRSTATLLKDCGYLDAPQALKTKDVEEALAQEPWLADKWLARGGDQRFSGGWGIERANGMWRVWNFANRSERLVEHNRLHAVAEFIVRYVGFMGDVLRRKQPDQGRMRKRRSTT